MKKNCNLLHLRTWFFSAKKPGLGGHFEPEAQGSGRRCPLFFGPNANN